MFNTPLIPPLWLVLFLAAITVGALLISRGSLRQRRRKLTALARNWHMHYSEYDVFELAAKVASHLPQPGAAAVVVRDCIYGTGPGGHRYFFRAEYTLGTIGPKRRECCLVAVREARKATGTTWESIETLCENGELIAMYEQLKIASEAKS